MSTHLQEEQQQEIQASSPKIIQQSIQQIPNINTNINKKSKRGYWKVAKFVAIQVTLNLILIGIIIWQVQYFLSLPPSNQVINDYKVNQPSSQVRPFDDYLYVLWPDDSDFSENRAKNINTMQNTELQVIFICLQTLDSLLLKDQPLHPAFQYLSSVHKSDYLRHYFMNLYGGAYADLKKIDESFIDARDKLRQEPLYLGAGYYERRAIDIGVDPSDKQMKQFAKKNYAKIIGNGQYMFRPGTEFTLRWHELDEQKLESIKEQLQATPAHHSRDKRKEKCGYPLKWAELGGFIIAKVQSQFFGRLTDGLPFPIMKDHML